MILQEREDHESIFLPAIDLAFFSKALQQRDASFFDSITGNLDSFKGLAHFGPFDQYRLLLTLFSSHVITEHLSTFIAFFEAKFFEDWLLAKFFFKDHPEITESIHSLPVEKIHSLQLIQFFTLKLPQRHTGPQSELNPVQVPMIKDLKSSTELLDSLSCLFAAKHLVAFAEPNFCIKYENSLDPRASGAFRVCSQAEIKLYLVNFRGAFLSWKSQAWEEYKSGLSHFVLSAAPHSFVQYLLRPQTAPTASRIFELSQVDSLPSIPSTTWFQILETLTLDELIQFLIFVTGQCRPVPFSVYFKYNSKPRLPSAQTCSRQLFLYVPIGMDSNVVEYLSESLKTSIHNYEGFEHYDPCMFQRNFGLRLKLFYSTSSPPTSTSILKKYAQFQQEFPEHLVLMQVGEFYEIYGEAVGPAAKILDVAVTRTPSKLSGGAAVPMTGFPLRSFDTFLGKLIRAGVSVVVADQFVVPNSARFDRKVSRVITPGTIVEEHLLDRNRNNFILLLEGTGKACAWMDVSTGDFFTASCADETEMLSLLARLKPREVLLGSEKNSSPLLSFLKHSSILIRHINSSSNSDDSDNIASADFSKVELEVSRNLLQYVKEILRGTPVAFKPLKRFAPAQHFMSIDADSFRSLDILTNSNSNNTRNNSNSSTLFNTMNECKTALGSRLLARRLQAPLLDPRDINDALDRVEGFTRLGIKSLEILQRKLDEVADIERIFQRLCLRRPQGVARDLKSLARSLLAAAEASKLAGKPADLFSSDLSSRLERILLAIVDKPPLRDSDGEMFRPGFDSELDSLRLLRDNSTEVFSELATSYRQSTSIPNIRIVPFKGQYVVEVPKSVQLPENFRPLMQTETRARYTTEDLLTKSLLLRTISERVIERELTLLSGLLEPILTLSHEIRSVADEVAHIDLEAAFASLALRHSYTRPVITEGNHQLEIIDGRHPILDKLFTLIADPADPENETDLHLLRQFTPNTLRLAHDSKFLLLTGPNMGGKSTFLRQNALIVLMAQCGSFVPARHCAFTPIDAIFTRIGASDDLSRDKSTFMMEMTETAHILRTATPRSLVLIDEIGRGTSASEGLALASAIAHHLIKSNRAWVLFATHYHEIIQSPLINSLSHPLQTARTQAQLLPDGTVLLLPKVSPGIATHSYALSVAALAGIPSQVISAAQTILQQK